MKTIVWKELREHGFWVPLALIATSLITLFGMLQQDLILNQLELMTSTVFAAAIIASLLGVLQSWGDRRLESRALLLHRSITAKEAFMAKFAAGLTMHSLATLPPLVFAAIWIAIDGRQTFAAYWDEMLPVMAYTLLAFMCWPAAFLVVQRNAWWLGSRLLPLPSAYWILVFSVVTSDSSVPIQVRWVGFGLAILAALTLTAAAYNTFGSMDKVGGPARATLGILHGLSLLVAAFVVVTGVQQHYAHRATVNATWTNLNVQLGRDGDPILTCAEQDFNGYQARFKVAKLSTEGSVLDKLQPVDQSELVETQLPSWSLYNSGGSLASTNVAQKTFQVLGALTRKNAAAKRTNGADSLDRVAFGQVVEQQMAVWMYVLDRRSGKILVYSEDKQLMHELTPESATGLTRFGELADTGSWNSSFYYTRHTSAFATRATSGETYLVVPFEDAAYAILNDGVTISRFFDMPPEVPLLASSRRNEYGEGTVDQGLLFSDRLVMIQPLGEADLEVTSETATVGGVAYSQTTVPLPPQLVNSSVIQLARLPGSSDELVALAIEGHDQYRWIRLNVAGEVLEERTYLQPTPSTHPNYRNEPELWLAALLPVGGFGLFGILVLCAGQGYEQFDWAYWSYWSADPAASIAFCVSLILQVVIALALTYWACRYYRLSKSVTRRWLLASFVGGPFVGLGLMTVYTRVATQTCVACRKKCRSDIGECEHCQQSLNQPARRGIEIFDDDMIRSEVTMAI